MDKTRKIIHIDMDAFYASVEQRDHPEWKGRPVIVGGDPQKRTVVCAASYEARAFGVRSAMPMRQAVALCPQAIVCEPHFVRYQEVSQRVMDILSRYSDVLEPLSLDECFLDVTQNPKNIPWASSIARLIREDIAQETGLTASAGVAPLKFLAKIASDMNKPNGMTVIRPEDVPAILATLPIEKIPGVGPVTLARLHALGIRTTGDLKTWHPLGLAEHFGKFGEVLIDMANGVDPRPVQARAQSQQIGQEETFDKDIRTAAPLHAHLDRLFSSVWAECEEQKRHPKGLTVKVRWDTFGLVTRSRSFREPLIHSHSKRCAHDLLDAILRLPEARPVRLLGVGFSRFEEWPVVRQPKLWEDR